MSSKTITKVVAWDILSNEVDECKQRKNYVYSIEDKY